MSENNNRSRSPTNRRTLQAIVNGDGSPIRPEDSASQVNIPYLTENENPRASSVVLGLHHIEAGNSVVRGNSSPRRKGARQGTYNYNSYQSHSFQNVTVISENVALKIEVEKLKGQLKDEQEKLQTGGNEIEKRFSFITETLNRYSADLNSKLELLEGKVDNNTGNMDKIMSNGNINEQRLESLAAQQIKEWNEVKQRIGEHQNIGGDDDGKSKNFDKQFKELGEFLAGQIKRIDEKIDIQIKSVGDKIDDEVKGLKEDDEYTMGRLKKVDEDNAEDYKTAIARIEKQEEDIKILMMKSESYRGCQEEHKKITDSLMERLISAEDWLGNIEDRLKAVETKEEPEPGRKDRAASWTNSGQSRRNRWKDDGKAFPFRYQPDGGDDGDDDDDDGTGRKGTGKGKGKSKGGGGGNGPPGPPIIEEDFTAIDEEQVREFKHEKMLKPWAEMSTYSAWLSWCIKFIMLNNYNSPIITSQAKATALVNFICEKAFSKPELDSINSKGHFNKMDADSYTLTNLFRSLRDLEINKKDVRRAYMAVWRKDVRRKGERASICLMRLTKIGALAGLKIKDEDFPTREEQADEDNTIYADLQDECISKLRLSSDDNYKLNCRLQDLGEPILYSVLQSELELIEKPRNSIYNVLESFEAKTNNVSEINDEPHSLLRKINNIQNFGETLTKNKRKSEGVHQGQIVESDESGNDEGGSENLLDEVRAMFNTLSKDSSKPKLVPTFSGTCNCCGVYGHKSITCVGNRQFAQFSQRYFDKVVIPFRENKKNVQANPKAKGKGKKFFDKKKGGKTKTFKKNFSSNKKKFEKKKEKVFKAEEDEEAEEASGDEDDEPFDEDANGNVESEAEGSDGNDPVEETDDDEEADARAGCVFETIDGDGDEGL